MFHPMTGGTAWNGAPSFTYPSTGPGPNSYVFLTVHNLSTTLGPTSITGGGTWVKIATRVGATKKLEIWFGYDFGTDRPKSLTMVGNSSGWYAVATIVNSPSDGSILPTFTVSSASGTGTASDPGTLTPAVGDMLYATHAASTATQARPSTGNAYIHRVHYAVGIQITESDICEASEAVATKQAWTIASGEWVAAQVMWTPPAASPVADALLVKGLDTALLDAASAY